MDNVFYIVGTIAFAMVIVYVGYLFVVEQKKKSSVRKNQIEIGKTVNERFDRIERSLQRIEAKMGSYQKEVREHFNKDNETYNDNLGKISQDINGIFELLNKQPEKKDDDSAFWGVLSGILSGALSSFLMKNVNSEKKETQKTDEQSKDCYGIQNKVTGEVLEQRFDNLLDAYNWLKTYIEENGFNDADFEVGKVVEKQPEETQE